MLVELGVVDQRYRAVLEVLDDGASVTEVARRYGVARQTVHAWLRRYASDGGLAGWWTGPRARRGARIRWLRRWRRRWSGCAGQVITAGSRTCPGRTFLPVTASATGDMGEKSDVI